MDHFALSVDHFPHVCRFCLKYAVPSNPHFPLFNQQQQQSTDDDCTLTYFSGRPVANSLESLPEIIALYLRLTVEPNDGLPMNICSVCERTFTAANMFRERCLRTVERLVQLRNEHQKQLHEQQLAQQQLLQQQELLQQQQQEHLQKQQQEQELRQQQEQVLRQQQQEDILQKQQLQDDILQQPIGQPQFQPAVIKLELPAVTVEPVGFPTPVRFDVGDYTTAAIGPPIDIVSTAEATTARQPSDALIDFSDVDFDELPALIESFPEQLPSVDESPPLLTGIVVDDDGDQKPDAQQLIAYVPSVAIGDVVRLTADGDSGVVVKQPPADDDDDDDTDYDDNEYYDTETADEEDSGSATRPAINGDAKKPRRSRGPRNLNRLPADGDDDKLFQCYICGVFVTRMRSHMRQHPQELLHECTQCGKGYLTVAGLHRHFDNKHGSVSRQMNVDETGAVTIARRKTPACSDFCTRRCLEMFDASRLTELHTMYWTGDDAQQDEFIAANVVRKRPYRIRTKAMVSRKAFTYQYYLRAANGRHVHVCQRFFHSALDINRLRVYRYFATQPVDDLPPTASAFAAIAQATIDDADDPDDGESRTSTPPMNGIRPKKRRLCVPLSDQED